MHCRARFGLRALIPLALIVTIGARPAAGQTNPSRRPLVIGVLSYEAGEAGAQDSLSRNAERGLAMGIEEARETARLFGRDVRESRTVIKRGDDAAKAARIMARTSMMSALLVTNPELTPAADSMAALGYAVIVLHTLPSAGDYCSRFTFSVYPPLAELDSAKAIYARAPSHQLVVDAHMEIWASNLERFGALELNDRFRARWKTGMTSEAWASWVAVKILSEAALRTRSIEPFLLLQYVSASEFDGHKGWPLTFRSADHILRQPIYIVSAGRGKVVAELPAGGRSEAESAESILDRVMPQRAHASCSRR